MDTVIFENEGNETGTPWTLDRPKPSERWIVGPEKDTGRQVLVAACETDEDAERILLMSKVCEGLSTEKLRAMTTGHLRYAFHAANYAIEREESET